MTVPFDNPRFGARFASSAEDVRACQALRARCFELGYADDDPFDPHYRHLMIIGAAGLIGTARLLVVRSVDQLQWSYAAQTYDLKDLIARSGAVLEIGRFCIAPESNDPDIIRLAWCGFAEVVDQEDVSLIIGCTTFNGVDASVYSDGFGLLARRYCAVPNVACHAGVETIAMSNAGTQGGAHQLPALLRSYLQMGAWVSGQAVIDRKMNTLHVLTGLEVNKIPEKRASALRRQGVLGTCA